MIRRSIAGKRKLVAVAVPLSNRQTLTDDEKVSLRHLEHFLGSYDKYLVAPEGLKINIPGFGIKRFGAEFFGSGVAHNRLMLSKCFYLAFSEYQFILNYHLDSLVLSDQLSHWCEQDYDFIGAPWLEHEEAPYHGVKIQEGKVGNGGFSLRKVSGFLSVLSSKKLAVAPSEYWAKYYAPRSCLVRLFNSPKLVLKMLGVRNNLRWVLNRIREENEEYFWSSFASTFYPSFKIPSVQEALKFSFECLPRFCFEQNGHRLPFGCHAWPKYDRAFWEPYLLK